MAGPGGGPPRKSHTKSRKGCKTCKRRHIRCDETFPQWYDKMCSRREELICVQSKLYKTQLPLRLYGSASYGRRARAEPSNTRSPNERRNRARAGSLADDRRATVSGTSHDFQIVLASILQHRSSTDTPHCGPVHRYASTRLQRLHSLGAENASVRTRHIANVAVNALTLCTDFSPLLCQVISC